MDGIKVRGLYKPEGTGYRLYEATLSNGDTHAAGAFSEEEFRHDALAFCEDTIEIVSVRCLEETDIGNGWKEGV